jgi:hypothetical protein
MTPQQAKYPKSVTLECSIGLQSLSAAIFKWDELLHFKV